MDMRNQIVVYKASDGNELAVKTDGETVWMTIEQMVKLLGRDRTVLICHVNNAIKEGELRRDINVQNLHNNHTGRGRPELVYDLDVMISVGYRVIVVDTDNEGISMYGRAAVLSRRKYGA